MIKKKLLCTVLAVGVISTSLLTPASNYTSQKVSAATVTSGTNKVELDPATKGHLIKNSTFDNGVGLPWTEVETFPSTAQFDIKGGSYNITVNKIADNPSKDNRWSVQFRHRGLTLEQGHTYTVKFTVTADQNCKIYPKIGQQGEPYKEYWNNNWNPYDLQAGVPKTVTAQFTMNDATDAKCEFAFHLAGDCAAAKIPYTFKFDNIYVDDPQFAGYPKTIPEPTNAVRVNQVGYFPKLEKKATVLSSATSPIDWKLVDADGNQVYQGKTKVFGADEASGDNVHIIDFTDFQKEGKGYKLVVNGADVPSNVSSTESMSFDIGTDLYTKMKSDAIKYFYQNRSGIDIKSQYVERPDLARAAGHPSDVLSNAMYNTDGTKTWYQQQYNPNYTLDVTGGWYDAGDHGKYIVNGGISTWTMMNQFERVKSKGGDLTKAPFADNSMNIPESGNGIPDILDESRWNVELFLKMQVPDGQALAGMVHHKAHDERWTALGIRPDQDPQPRYLQPPSTAATLNFAAVTAQAARLWKDIDPTFANKCQVASEKAWKAAKAHPDIYKTLEGDVGGGNYGDTYVGDEFYWAACELYATTGNDTYLNEAKSSKHYLEMPTELTGGEDDGTVGCFDWGNTQGLGTITLATVKTNLPQADLTKAKNNIKAAADKFIDIENSQGYGTPISESNLSVVQSKDKIKGLPWGSNAFVTNSAIVMAYANDFSDGSTTKYLDGAARSMDYLLGCNPNVQSYVTGYGENPLENPHHRFWAYQTDNSFPKAPAGCISGGPNSGLQDPWVKGSGWLPGAMASEKCFMDNIESWSTNEITINWNAPFAWITSYIDDNHETTIPPEPIVYGDLSGDGVVNISDLLLMQNYLNYGDAIPNKAGEKVADLNGDGKVTLVDSLYLKKFVTGKIKKFPVEG
ncbi:glycoside hydrolase family 9 protein [Clostridium sp. SHJSY1]|uniref:glycoside hydrolase family 9 protein n=1 Tax=Clostridium sp. SHJSY1 TaxID=2942483 RepID=UPI002874921C|nr:glycoside hydrolase family 9 protein [Clostridium sp. SHJSY1]MDS0526344.1 glycoside hydrolase family 9 protein [Clostridium sp. SHJSY1]